MPFMPPKLRDWAVTTELASFLLYTLSPYYPNPDILDKPDLLTDLTRQFRSFVSRTRRARPKNQEDSLQDVLDSLTPSCQDLVAGCQTGSGAILQGAQCCKLLFQDKLLFSPNGICLVGGGDQLALFANEPKFPVAPRPFSTAKLSLVLNMTHQMPFDHRVVPWDPANDAVVTVSMISEAQKPTFRDAKSQDLVLRPGHLVSVLARKRQILRSESKLMLGEACKMFPYDSAQCKSSVVQAIGEKSVNCSLISLDKVDGKWPFCGPLEGIYQF